MVTPTAGTVVLVPFPFSDLSQAKLRPAVVLADVGRGDWVMCRQVGEPGRAIAERCGCRTATHDSRHKTDFFDTC